MIRHVSRVEDIPNDRPLHIFGAGQGGRIVRQVLDEQGGHHIAGFIDNFRNEPLDGLPVRSLADFLDQTSGTAALIVVASQFWPDIVRQLRDAGCENAVNAFSIIASFQKEARRLVSRQTLAAAVEAGLGLTLRDLVTELLASPHAKPPGPWRSTLRDFHDLAKGAPFFVVGSDDDARRFAMLAVQSGASEFAGFIDPTMPDGFSANGFDAMFSLPHFLETTDRTSVVVNAHDDWPSIRPRLEQAGFTRLFDIAQGTWQAPARPPGPILTPAGPLPEEPLVSVVLVCRNAAASIRRSMDSILRQTYGNIEYVIQDGASTDGTLDIIEEYRRRPGWRDRIRLVSEVDGNASVGLIRALRRCRGDIIANCMADEELLPDAVAEAVEAFRARPGVGAITGDSYVTDQHGRFTGTFDGGPFNLVEYLFGAYCPYFPASVFARRALEEIGLHDDDWNQDAVEFELWCRLATRHSIAHHPFRFSKYALHGGQLSNAIAPIRFLLFQRIAVLERLFGPDAFFGPMKDAYNWWEECLVRQYVHFHNHLLRSGLDAGQLGVSLRPPDATLRPIDVPPVAMGIHQEVAALYEQRGQIEESVAMLRAARRFHDAGPDSLACQALLKSPRATNRDFLDAQIDWVERHVRQRPLLDAAALPPLKAGPDGPRIKVAYICPFATASYFRYQAIPFIVRHDRAAFEIYCYTSGLIPQELADAGVTIRLVDHLSDEDFVALLRADGIDIALELTGFSVGHRYRAMAERVAPVQISYINHAGTCGVPAFDYCLADWLAAPEWLDPYYTETIHRLDGSFFCFDYRGSDAPPVAPVPSATNGHITFGCFGSGSKINLDLIALWARLLDAVPGAKLLLRNASLSSADNRAFMADRFARFGIGTDRLLLEPGTGRLEIMADYARVDISLDTFPYCGGNTIAESLNQGCPVVTLRGRTFATCYGSSILAASGCGDLIAQTPDAYIRLAADLAASPQRLAMYRANLRDMMVTHGFSDSERFVRGLEAAYRMMLQRLQPPE